ncbi:hypothetical protein HN51_038255 [Arachis hypogaea]
MGPLIDLEAPLLDDGAFNEFLNFPPNENQNVREHDDYDVHIIMNGTHFSTVDIQFVPFFRPFEKQE